MLIYPELLETNQAYSHEKFAQAVESLLFPIIMLAVNRGAATGIAQLHKELEDQAQRITEAKHRIFMLDDELYQTNATLQQYSQIHKTGRFRNSFSEEQLLNNWPIRVLSGRIPHGYLCCLHS